LAKIHLPLCFALVDRYEFHCPNCHAILRVPLTASGLTGKCGSCQDSVTAPTPPATVLAAVSIDERPIRKAKTPLESKTAHQTKQKFRRRFTADPLTKATAISPPNHRSSAHHTFFADIDTASVKNQKFELSEDVQRKTYLQRDHSHHIRFAKKNRSRQTLLITIGLITGAVSFFLYSLGWRLK
jgi:hypothetical protein